jgi:pimeloyl-ACP methyl ester carboxylesterase
MSCWLFLPWPLNYYAWDSATIYAEFKKRGSHAILLAHGAIFNKESWGEFEQQLLDNNYTVLAIDFRGYGKSTKGQQSNALYLDILAGVEFLQSQPEISKISVLFKINSIVFILITLYRRYIGVASIWVRLSYATMYGHY